MRRPDSLGHKELFGRLGGIGGQESEKKKSRKDQQTWVSYSRLRRLQKFLSRVIKASFLKGVPFQKITVWPSLVQANKAFLLQMPNEVAWLREMLPV